MPAPGPDPTPDPGPARRPRPVATLVVVLLAFVTVPMAISGSAVALPEIGCDLDAAGAPLQWVVNAYNLTFASLTLVAGSASDLWGRRRVFAAGGAVFAAGSLASALAPTVLALDLARGLAGIGAAGVFASGGAILGTTFDGPARTRAFAALGSAAGLGLAAGPTLSGLLVGTLGWRAGFGAHALVLLAALAGVGLVVESRAAHRPRLDVTGAALFVAGLGALVVGSAQGPEWGWTSGRTLTALLGGALLLCAFGVAQTRSAAPLLAPALLRDRRFTALCAVPVVTTLGFVTLLTYLPSYLVGAAGLSAGAAGGVLFLLTAPVLLAPPLAGALVNRGASARALITGAQALFAVGNAWLTVIEPDGAVGPLIAPLALTGLGAGIAFGVGDGLAIGSVGPERAGMAAGFLNTLRIGSEAVVIAVYGAVLVSLIAGRVGSHEAAARVAAGAGPAGGPPAAAFTEALRYGLYGTAALCALGAVAVGLALRTPPRPPATGPTPGPTPEIAARRALSGR
ncbi:MFS transporter (plasmid) [Streptomyces sp. BI20]|uniref:MFS transporter n=1 Tax=Streptomyces sp. BI20 TaxID=3403460 RepID=UPI003C73CB9F